MIDVTDENHAQLWLRTDTGYWILDAG